MGERKKPPIAWTDAPEAPVLPRIEILSPKPGMDVWVICTSERITGVMTHYLHQRTRPCNGDEDTCEGCLLSLPKRWKGYLAGSMPPKGKQFLVEITYEGYRNCKELHGLNAVLYGKKVILHRAGAARNSRVVVTVAPGEGPAFADRPFDVQEALLRIWFGERPFRDAKKRVLFEERMKAFVDQAGTLPAD
jgi:hypothetical protein